MGKDLAQHHEFARHEARGLSSRLRPERSQRQGCHLVADRAVHVGQEVKGHRVGAHGQQILCDEGERSACGQDNEPGAQTHAPGRPVGGQGDRGRDKGDERESPDEANDAREDGRLGEAGTPLVGEGFAQARDEAKHVSVLSRARSCAACTDDRRVARGGRRR